MRTTRQMLTIRQYHRLHPWVELHRFQSRSDPEKGYKVHVHRTKRTLSCTCPGWIHHRKCWHTTQISEVTGLPVEGARD